MRRPAVMPLVLLLLLTTAIPAAADPPQTSFEEDFAYNALAVECTAFGYDFDVWDHIVGHASEVWYLDRNGAPIRMLAQTQGTDHLYKSTTSSVFVATGPFNYSEHARVVKYVPGDPSATLVEDNMTGTQWNVHLPNGVMIHSAGQWVYILQGEPPDVTLIDMPKRAGLTEFDDEAICAALAEQG
jgi:hypothetical protein